MPVHRNSNGTVDLSFVPKQPGTYTAQLQQDGVEIFHSPFQFEVTPEAAKAKNQGHYYCVDVPEMTLDMAKSNPKVLLTAPNGSTITGKISLSPSDKLMISFCPPCAGIYSAQIHGVNHQPLLQNPMLIEVEGSDGVMIGHTASAPISLDLNQLGLSSLELSVHLTGPDQV